MTRTKVTGEDKGLSFVSEIDPASCKGKPYVLYCKDLDGDPESRFRLGV